jgi:hypothetical protein
LRRDLVLLAAIAAVYNLPQLLSGSVQFDGLEVHYASQRYLSDELHAGSLPFWTPYLFSGFPFLADLQVAAWYPLNWPFFLVGITPRAIGVELLLHTVIACWGAYLLARRLIGNARAAVVAAMLYGLGGWFAAHSQHVGMFDTAAWLPWLLLLLDTLRGGLTPGRLALAGALGGAIALPGSFQLALYTFTFVGIWAVCEAIALRSVTAARRMGIGLGVAVVWGGLLSAIMLLPGLELVGQSQRAQLNALDLPDIGYFHLGSLLTLVDPDYYGLLSGHYVGPGDSTQHYFYAGLLLAPLAVLGLRDRRVTRTAAALSLPFLWYALGPVGGVFRLAARLPGFNSVELPMHGWFLPALGLALLGGAGVAAVDRRFGQRWRTALIGVLLIDALLVNQLLNPLAYARAAFEARYGSVLNRLAAQVAAAEPTVQRIYAPPETAVGYRNHALQSRVPTTYGYNPLELTAYAEYVAAAQSNPLLIAGLAANYQLTDDGRLQPVPNALPLAYFAANLIEAPDPNASVRGLTDLDPRSATLVDGPLPEVQPDPTASVSVEASGQDWLVLHYDSATPNLVRTAVPAYPGWHATLDGAELPLVHVDHAFTGIVVPSGAGDVRLSYAPRVFWLGAVISVVALLALLGVAVFGQRRAG